MCSNTENTIDPRPERSIWIAIAMIFAICVCVLCTVRYGADGIHTRETRRVGKAIRNYELGLPVRHDAVDRK